MICVHELQTGLGGRRGVGDYETVVGEEGGREGDGADAEFPAGWVAGDTGGGGVREEGLAEELVAEARAEYLYFWVVCVEIGNLVLAWCLLGRKGNILLVNSLRGMIQEAESYAEAAVRVLVRAIILK